MLRALTKLSGHPRVIFDVETLETVSVIEGSIDSQVYLALHNARGAVWSAMGEVSSRGIQLYQFLAELRGRRSYGPRYVETLARRGYRFIAQVDDSGGGVLAPSHGIAAGQVNVLPREVALPDEAVAPQLDAGLANPPADSSTTSAATTA